MSATNMREVTEEAWRTCSGRETVVSTRSSASRRRTSRDRPVARQSQLSTVAFPLSYRSENVTTSITYELLLKLVGVE